MRLIDADAFAEFLKDAVKRQKYEDTKIDGLLTVADVIEAVISELDGTSFDGFKNAPTIEPDSDTISRQQAIDEVSNNSPELAKENGELISRQAVLDAILQKPAWHNSEGSFYHSDDIKDAVNAIPLSPGRPKGHWGMVSQHEIPPTYVYSCSVCGHKSFGFYNYCPNCGADMRQNGGTV